MIRDSTNEFTTSGEEPESSSTYPPSATDQKFYQSAVQMLRKELPNSNSTSRKHALEVLEYRKTIEELNTENDELVNDIHQIVTENDDLKNILEESQDKYRHLKKSYLTLIQDRDALVEELELCEVSDEGEIYGMVDQVRAQTKAKLREAASQSKELQAAVDKMSAEKDEMENTIETMIAERKDVDRKMGAMYELINDITRTSNSSSGDKTCLEYTYPQDFSSKGKTAVSSVPFSGFVSGMMSAASRRPGSNKNLQSEKGAESDGELILKRRPRPRLISTSSERWIKMQSWTARSTAVETVEKLPRRPLSAAALLNDNSKVLDGEICSCSSTSSNNTSPRIDAVREITEKVLAG